jgi:hypothetical protein
MRFSDMMGQRAQPSHDDDAPSETVTSDSVTSETRTSEALAPYLDTPGTAGTEAAVEGVREAEPDIATPRVDTIESSFSALSAPVEAIATVAPSSPVEMAPVAASDSIATATADFTPLSDDILPRRRR